MDQKPDSAESVSFKELLVANAVMADALTQLLIEKGIISQEEFFTKLEFVQAAYKARQND